LLFRRRVPPVVLPNLPDGVVIHAKGFSDDCTGRLVARRAPGRIEHVTINHRCNGHVDAQIAQQVTFFLAAGATVMRLALSGDVHVVLDQVGRHIEALRLALQQQRSQHLDCIEIASLGSGNDVHASGRVLQSQLQDVAKHGVTGVR